MTTNQDASKYQAGDPPSPEEVALGVVVSPDTKRENRIPPGQTRTRKWPVLQYGQVIDVPLDTWRLEVRGLVERPLSLSWDEYQSLPRIKVFADFHCVTQWSRLGNLWEGMSVREIMDRVGVRAAAKFVVAAGYDGSWTTNLPLADFLAADALLADRHDGEPITADHGGPLRLDVPRLYAWKSAKWLKSIQLLSDDKPGLWEKLGYHNHGDPWFEERHRW